MSDAIRIPSGPTDEPIRWLRGHHLFFVCLNALIIVLGRTQEALRAGELDRARVGLRNAISLLASTGACFRYTGDINPKVFKNTARASMEIHEGFTGLWSKDHQVMIRLLKDTKSLFARLHPSDASLCVEFDHAVSHCWLNHVEVCSIAVGEQLSLNASASSSAEVKQTAPRQLRDFYRRKATDGIAVANQMKAASIDGKTRCPIGFGSRN